MAVVNKIRFYCQGQGQRWQQDATEAAAADERRTASRRSGSRHSDNAGSRGAPREIGNSPSEMTLVPLMGGGGDDDGGDEGGNSGDEEEEEDGALEEAGAGDEDEDEEAEGDMVVLDPDHVSTFTNCYSTTYKVNWKR